MEGGVGNRAFLLFLVPGQKEGKERGRRPGHIRWIRPRRSPASLRKEKKKREETPPTSFSPCGIHVGRKEKKGLPCFSLEYGMRGAGGEKKDRTDPYVELHLILDAINPNGKIREQKREESHDERASPLLTVLRRRKRRKRRDGVLPRTLSCCCTCSGKGKKKKKERKRGKRLPQPFYDDEDVDRVTGEGKEKREYFRPHHFCRSPVGGGKEWKAPIRPGRGISFPITPFSAA